MMNEGGDDIDDQRVEVASVREINASSVGSASSGM